MDTRAAFLVQKCAYEYSRARAGILSRKLFKEVAFKEAMKESAWLNYPVGLEMVSVMAEHTLRPHLGGEGAGKGEADDEGLRSGMIAAAEAVTERYPIPDGFEPQFWAKARTRIAGRINKTGLADPRPIWEIPLTTADEFIANLPFHESVMTADSQLVTNNLCFNLCRMHDDLVRGSDLGHLAGVVAAGPRRAAPPTLSGTGET